MATMWNDLVFDRAGNLFMTDDKPRLWRVTRDGHASIWFEDPRLTGFFGFAGGPLGGRIDPTGKFLYFTITISAAFPGEAVVYRIPLVDHPSAADLEVVHRFPVVPGQQLPQAAGLAFAEHPELGVSQSFESSHRVLSVFLLVEQIAVEAFHERSRCNVWNLPQAGHDGLSPRDMEGSLQTEQSFATSHFAKTGLTRGEDRHLNAAQIEVLDFRRRQDSVVLSFSQFAIRSGKGQTREQAGRRGGHDETVVE